MSYPTLSKAASTKPVRQHVIGVVAHEQRRQHAQTLSDSADAVHIGFDDGSIGAGTNHRRMWEVLLRHDAQWCVVLEDDAVPVPGFTAHLGVLQHAPTPVVSLYLGRQRPPQHQAAIQAAIEKADANDAAWITSPHLMHHVAVAIKRELLAGMLTSIKPYLPPDEAISQWARREGHHIAYTWPSLVDHNDLLPTLIKHRDRQPRTPGRTAWRTGTRTSYDTGTVTM